MAAVRAQDHGHPVSGEHVGHGAGGRVQGGGEGGDERFRSCQQGANALRGLAGGAAVVAVLAGGSEQNPHTGGDYRR